VHGPGLFRSYLARSVHFLACESVLWLVGCDPHPCADLTSAEFLLSICQSQKFHGRLITGSADCTHSYGVKND